MYPWKHVTKHHNLLRWRTWKCRSTFADKYLPLFRAHRHLGSQILRPAVSLMEQVIISEAWASPSRAFKEASTSSSVRPCLTSQTTVSHHQVKYRTTLGKMITQIWSFSSCLVSSHPFQRFRNPPPPPSLFLSEAASALSPAVYPHPLVASSSSNFITTYVHPASLSQRKWHIKMIIFEELMHNLQNVLSSIYILLYCLMIFCFLCAFVPTLVNIHSKTSD